MLESYSLRQTLRRFPIKGGASLGLWRFFLNQLLTGQHLANSGEGQLKKTPCTYVYPIYLQMINYDARVFKFSKLFFWFTVAPPVRASISRQLIIVFNNNNISKHFVFATNIKDHKKRESWPSYELMSISSECQPCFFVSLVSQLSSVSSGIWLTL